MYLCESYSKASKNIEIKKESVKYFLKIEQGLFAEALFISIIT